MIEEDVKSHPSYDGNNGYEICQWFHIAGVFIPGMFLILIGTISMLFPMLKVVTFMVGLTLIVTATILKFKINKNCKCFKKI
jgi:hypothetical protein